MTTSPAVVYLIIQTFFSGRQFPVATYYSAIEAQVECARYNKGLPENATSSYGVVSVPYHS